MKNILLAITLFFLAYSCNKTEPLPPNTYEIQGKAKGIYNGIRAYIKDVGKNRKEMILDTAIVMNEAFLFKGSITNASINVITINGVIGNLPFVLEPSKIYLEIYKDSLSQSKISGSKINEDYNLFKIAQRNKSMAIKQLRLQINAARTSGNTALYPKLISKNTELNNELDGYAHEYIGEHPDSDFSLVLLENMIDARNNDAEKFKTSFATLSKVINRNEVNKNVGKKIEAFIYILESKQNLEIGKIAPNFTSITPTGEMLSLNDMKGKATIIDFWASWCKPCRMENPNVVKVYKKYHDKGLEIISISLDRESQKDRWLKAIEDDNMDWNHVSNLKFWNDPVARLYNVHAIPATFILDKDGRIVAKKLRGDALEKQIASLLE